MGISVIGPAQIPSEWRKNSARKEGDEWLRLVKEKQRNELQKTLVLKISRFFVLFYFTFTSLHRCVDSLATSGICYFNIYI